MTDAALTSTRRALHAVAELVLAGPQHRRSGTIRLRMTAQGFATVAEPALQVVGTDLVAGAQRVPIDGQTPRGLASAVGVEPGSPVGVYGDDCGVPLDDIIAVDPAAARRLLDAYALGDAAMRLLAPEEEPVLWPEHFDVGIRVDGVNFGVSPGDDHVGEPYAYVGVDPVPSDPYWNAPFGRTAAITDFDGAGALRSFFADGRDRYALRG